MVDFNALGGKARDFLDSEKGEKLSDDALARAAAAAKKVTKGAHDDKIESARDAADRKLGR